ncbi:hypothetical protein ACFY8W_25810 [Streptomyces sp. NPDC012637]|uniref:hypothetical protein n=1 Tax=Streptomyces sp. NPDC012637 TaxID=3364842 RepID=UPI0036EE595B
MGMKNTTSRIAIASAAALIALGSAAGSASAADIPPTGSLLSDPHGFKDESFKFLQDDPIDDLLFVLLGEDLDA